MAASTWKKSRNPDNRISCAHTNAMGFFDCSEAARWTRNGTDMCAKHGPKPPAKRKAKFKRWTYAGSGWAMQDSLLVFRGSEADIKFLIRKLNAARVALPTGRKAKS